MTLVFGDFGDTVLDDPLRDCLDLEDFTAELETLVALPDVTIVDASLL